MTKLFDAHCHLQDPRILNRAPKLIKTALENGVVHFAVNGITEKDWHVVKEMSDHFPSVIPCFGIHPWFAAERTSNWLSNLKEFFDATPSAAVGEIGLDKGPHLKTINFSDQVEIFIQQLQLAKELERPASVHCVDAFEDLLEILKSLGPFPAGIILHSYLGSSELVPELAKLGAYFSFSGHNMSMEESKTKEMLKAVPSDRILLETDSPDALPRFNNLYPVFQVEEDDSVPEELQANDGSLCCNVTHEARDSSTHPKEMLNQPANIHGVLSFIASLLELPKEELADISYRNAVRLFSYDGSKVLQG